MHWIIESNRRKLQINPVAKKKSGGQQHSFTVRPSWSMMLTMGTTMLMMMTMQPVQSLPDACRCFLLRPAYSSLCEPSLNRFFYSLTGILYPMPPYTHVCLIPVVAFLLTRFLDSIHIVAPLSRRPYHQRRTCISRKDTPHPHQVLWLFLLLESMESNCGMEDVHAGWQNSSCSCIQPGCSSAQCRQHSECGMFGEGKKLVQIRNYVLQTISDIDRYLQLRWTRNYYEWIHLHFLYTSIRIPKIPTIPLVCL